MRTNSARGQTNVAHLLTYNGRVTCGNDRAYYAIKAEEFDAIVAAPEAGDYAPCKRCAAKRAVVLAKRA